MCSDCNKKKQQMAVSGMASYNGNTGRYNGVCDKTATRITWNNKRLSVSNETCPITWWIEGGYTIVKQNAEFVNLSNLPSGDYTLIIKYTNPIEEVSQVIKKI